MSVAASWRQHLRDLCIEDNTSSNNNSNRATSSVSTTSTSSSTTSTSSTTTTTTGSSLYHSIMVPPPPSSSSSPKQPTKLQQQLLETAALVRDKLAVESTAPQSIPSKGELYFPSSFEQGNPKKVDHHANRSQQQHEHNNNSSSNNNNNNLCCRRRRGFCNWLIPNHIMIGQYPGESPLWDSPSSYDVDQHVQRIVTATATATSPSDTAAAADDDDDQGGSANGAGAGAGVSVFCSLQSETPAQDDYDSWIFSSNNNHNENENEKEVAATETQPDMRPDDNQCLGEECGKVFLKPEYREHLPKPFKQYAPIVKKYYDDCHSRKMNHKGEALEKEQQHVDDVDDDVDNDNDDTVIFNGGKPIFLHSPIADLSVPESQEPLQRLLLQLLQHMIGDNNNNNNNNNNNASNTSNNNNNNNVIYIHCWGGRGRAGLVGACLLTLIWPHLSSQIILDWVQTAYETRAGHEYLTKEFAYSPQTVQQRQYVTSFVEEYQQLYNSNNQLLLSKE